MSLALPGLYNVYNALAAAALACALGVPLQQILAGLQQTRAAFGRAETIVLKPAQNGAGSGARSAGGAAAGAPRELRILLVKNPAGANEVLRTLALEPGEHDVLGVLNDKIADGRDVSWIWDADFELLADRIRRFTCSGSRARRTGRAAEVRRDRPRADRDRARPRARPCRWRRWTGPTRRRRSTRCRPTRRCSRCASCSSRAGRRAARGRERSGDHPARGRLARPRVRRLPRRHAAVARARRRRPASRSSTSAQAPDGSRSSWPARGTR